MLEDQLFWRNSDLCTQEMCRLYFAALGVMRIWWWISSSSSGNAFLNVLNDLRCCICMGVNVNAHFLHLIYHTALQHQFKHLSLRSIFSWSNTRGKILWQQQTAHCEGTTKKNHHETRKCSPWCNFYTPKWDTSTCELICTTLPHCRVQISSSLTRTRSSTLPRV